MSPESSGAARSGLLSDAASLMRIRSANPPGRERPVAEWLAGRLERVADRVSVETFAEGRANMMATFEFGPGPGFLLCSHTDVVPVQDEGQWEPYIRAGRLIGRGACDAKGAIAAMIAACERLVACRAELAGTLTLACVADEESDAAGVLALVSRGFHADGAVVGEPTGNIAVLSSRGALRLGVRFEGRAAHASSPSQGVNAIYGAARFILAIEALDGELSSRGSTGSCSATIVDGGSRLNVIPDTCTVKIDRRLGLEETAGAALAGIEACLTRVAALAPGVSFEWSPAGPWVDSFELQVGDEFVSRILSALGQGTPGPIFPAVSDAPHLIAAGIPTAILGPGSLTTAHSSSEHVDVHELETAVDLYERLVRAYLAPAAAAPIPSR